MMADSSKTTWKSGSLNISMNAMTMVMILKIRAIWCFVLSDAEVLLVNM